MKKEVQKCRKCEKPLLAHEKEIYNEFHEIGGYCANKKCERFEVLVI